MKAGADILKHKKPRIDVRHHIDHDGLAAKLGYAFIVDGNEDGSGGDGDGGAGDGSDGGASGSSDGGASGGSSDAGSGSDGGAANSSDGMSGGVADGGSIGSTSDGSSPTGGSSPGTASSPDSGTTGGVESLFGDVVAVTTFAQERERDDKPRQFETREQGANRRASGAGAQRIDNDADLLGYSAPRVRRGQARRTLGSR